MIKHILFRILPCKCIEKPTLNLSPLRILQRSLYSRHFNALILDMQKKLDIPHVTLALRRIWGEKGEWREC